MNFSYCVSGRWVQSSLSFRCPMTCHGSMPLKLSTARLLVDKVQNIVGLYMPPLNRVIVLCVDKSQIQAGAGSRGTGLA